MDYGNTQPTNQDLARALMAGQPMAPAPAAPMAPPNPGMMPRPNGMGAISDADMRQMMAAAPSMQGSSPETAAALMSILGLR